MTENQRSETAPPPHAQLVQMGMAHWVSHIVYVAAKLSLADHLASGAMTAEQLAGPTATHAPSLYRLMRTLASLGLLSEDADHRFALTPLGDALRDDAPGAPVFNASPRGVSANRCWLSSVRIPRLASVRIRR